MNTLNIVIPVLNEERSLVRGIETTISYLTNTIFNESYSITIADNGSTDKTQEIALELCNIYTNVDYFKVSKKGVGLAFREAIIRNKCDFIGYMDVDLATELRYLVEVYNTMYDGKADIVVGSRLLQGAKVVGRSVKREITSRGLNILLHIFLGVKFSDAMCGFKFYRREIAERLVAECSKTDGWFFCAEMMIQAEWDNISIHEIPIEWHDDDKSKVKIVSLSADYLSEIVRLYKKKKKLRRSS